LREKGTSFVVCRRPPLGHGLAWRRSKRCQRFGLIGAADIRFFDEWHAFSSAGENVPENRRQGSRGREFFELGKACCARPAVRWYWGNMRACAASAAPPELRPRGGRPPARRSVRLEACTITSPHRNYSAVRIVKRHPAQRRINEVEFGQHAFEPVDHLRMALKPWIGRHSSISSIALLP
jgi:hypothetical protein